MWSKIQICNFQNMLFKYPPWLRAKKVGRAVQVFKSNRMVRIFVITTDAGGEGGVVISKIVHKSILIREIVLSSGIFNIVL